MYFYRNYYFYVKYSYVYGENYSRMVKKKSHVEFLYKLNALNPKITVLGTYESNRSKIAVKCDRCGWEWSPIAYSLLKGHGCARCTGVKQKTHAEFVKELKSKRNDVIIIGRYVKALQKTKFRFLKCGHEWDITPAHILSGRGCPVCAHSRRGASQRLTMEMFLERLHKIDPNLVVRKGVMYKNNHTRMPLRCKACGYKYKISPHDVLSNHGCPNCHRACTSFFEQFIYHTFTYILGKSKVISRDKTEIGAELDIYIPELRAAIEPGSWYWHKDLVAKDRRKHLLCKEKGIRLITIYDHYDEITVPFNDCFVTNCDLSNVRNRDKLIEITKTVLAEFGLNPNLDTREWEKIKRNAKMDSRRMTTEEFKEELSGINNKIEIIGDYTKANDKIKARCKTCNHEWDVAPTSLRLGTGCPRCAGTLKITHNQFVERLNKLQPNIIPLTEYINTDTKVTIKCKVCGYIWSTHPYHLTAKSRSHRTGCPKCSKKLRRTHDDFVAEIASLSPTIKILGTFSCVKNPILVQCGECNKIWQPRPRDLLKGCGCKSCKSKDAIRQRSRKVRCITTGEVFNSLREAAEKYNSHSSVICQCCNNPTKHKHAGGQEWEYINMFFEGLVTVMQQIRTCLNRSPIAFIYLTSTGNRME